MKTIKKMTMKTVRKTMMMMNFTRRPACRSISLNAPSSFPLDLIPSWIFLHPAYSDFMLTVFRFQVISFPPVTPIEVI